MTPEIAALILKSMIEYGPGVARSIVRIFQKEVIAAADWEEVFKLAESKSYAQYVAPKA